MMDPRFKEVLEEARRRVDDYKKLGVNPLALATGCAVKVDLERVVYPALSRLKRTLRGNVEIAPREDADLIEAPKGGVEVVRKIYPLENPESMNESEVRELSGSHVIVLIQVHQRHAFDEESFYARIAPFYKRLERSGGKFYIGKGHSIVTPFEGDEFILMDFVRVSGEEPDGFTAVNNDTIHIIDPTADPTDYRQVAGALNNSLNDVYVMGATEDVTIAPVVNAPTEEVREMLEANVERYSREFGAKVLPLARPKRGRLLLGATVMAFTDRTPPIFYDRVKPGDKVLVTRPIGELAPINVFLAAVMDDRVVDDLEEYGISGEEVLEAKEKAFNTIAKSNREAGRVIAKYLPRYGEEFRDGEHIYATIDVTGPGVYVVWELAMNAKAHIKLWEIPLLYPKFSRYATDRYLMLNATAGTNGAFIILAPDSIAESIVKDLRALGYPASVIGEVVDVGSPRVEAPKELAEYVADKRVLEKFTLMGS
ncbi:MAG: SelD-related putative sulfur metabolism protein [Desulfurococcales archaeon]|nr:SelD-related putative sulfur metabolism protein [Desulfurococcales archaeon]